MQEITVTKKVEGGRAHITVEHDGASYHIGPIESAGAGEMWPYYLMHKFAQTTGEDKIGSLVELDTEVYGKHRMVFHPPDTSGTPQEVAEAIVRHLETVRQWVESCKEVDRNLSGTATVTLAELPEVATELHRQNRLYYRTAGGQIKRLE